MVFRNDYFSHSSANVLLKKMLKLKPKKVLIHKNFFNCFFIKDEDNYYLKADEKKIESIFSTLNLKERSAIYHNLKNLGLIKTAENLLKVTISDINDEMNQK